MAGDVGETRWAGLEGEERDVRPGKQKFAERRRASNAESSQLKMKGRRWHLSESREAARFSLPAALLRI